MQNATVTMQALLLDAESRTAILSTIPAPHPAPNELLVKVSAISLNPIDSLYVAHPLGRTGRTVGSDFTGTVVSFGSHVPASAHISTGDRVAGFLQGACSVNDRPGAFAEYLTVPWDLVWRVPAAVTPEEAAGVSLVALTAAQGTWFRMGLSAPFEYYDETASNEGSGARQRETSEAVGSETINVLIYSASTSVGLYAAQMARISARLKGKEVRLFGTASKSRWEFLRAEPYCYEYLVDYRDADWEIQVVKASGGVGMHYAYDGLSEGDSVERVASTLAADGTMAIVRSREGGAWEAGNLPIEPMYGAVWEGLGEEVQYQGMTVKKSLTTRAFAVAFYKWLGAVVGLELKTVPIRLMPGGLERVVADGFALLGAGGMEDRKASRAEQWMRPVSAEKLVYRIDK